MLISQTAHYALRAVNYLATSGYNQWHLVKDVAEVTDIPAPYLARIMSTLAKRGILKSRTGMTGGFSIGDSNLNYNLYDIVANFDKLEDNTECLFGFTTCCKNEKCSLHNSWNDIKHKLIDTLKSTSLNDLRHMYKDFDWFQERE